MAMIVFITPGFIKMRPMSQDETILEIGQQCKRGHILNTHAATHYIDEVNHININSIIIYYYQ